MGQRQGSNHIALSALRDFVCGLGALSAEAHDHVEGCEQCQSDATWLRWINSFGDREKNYEPPAWAVANAGKVFKLRKPGVVRFAEEVVAALVYDSFNEPLPFGVRKRDLPARQALYRTDDLQLDLKIELSSDRSQIIGQIIADKADVKTNGLEVELREGGLVVGKSKTNLLGEFIFQNLPEGNYELQVHCSGTTVKLPPLPLGSA